VTDINRECYHCGFEFEDDAVMQTLTALDVRTKEPYEYFAHVTCPKGRYYPEQPPMWPGETADQYTDRLTGADRTGRRPYDHARNRQCSIGYHDECSDGKYGDYTGECACPHHTDPNYRTEVEQEQDDVRAEIERIVKDAFYDERNAGGSMDHAAALAAKQVVAMLIEEEYL